MSFFELTMLGFENKLREAKREKTEVAPNYSFEEQLKYEFSNMQIHKYGTGPQGSHSKYKEMMRKHIRNDNGPINIFKRPVTCSQDIGWWNESEPINKNIPWSNVKKHVFPMSEMTRFADEMCLTDKQFKMY